MRQATMAFIMQCRTCRHEIQVGETRAYRDPYVRGRSVAYYDPRTTKLVGIGDGTVEGFECYPCVLARRNKLHQDLGEGPIDSIDVSKA